MRYWIGLLLLAAAAWLFAIARAQQRRVRAARQAAGSGASADASLHPSLALLADLLPPLVMLALVVVAAQIVLAYVVMGAGRLFSLFDLAAFLALLAAYAFWMIVKTQYREAPQYREGQGGSAAPPSPPIA